MTTRTINLVPGQVLIIKVEGYPVLELLADLKTETVYQRQICCDFRADWGTEATRIIDQAKQGE